MPEDNFLEQLFDDKKLRILKLLLRESDKEYYLREISNLANVSDASTYRIIQLLSALKLVETIKIKKLKLYKLANNKNTKLLETFLKDDIRALDTFVEELQSLENIDQVILHGDEKPDKANILLIGTNIDSGRVKAIVASIKETFNFTISTLNLEAEQYAQMSSMGLYSGKKKVLFTK